MSTDRNIEQIQRGQEARLIRGAIEDRILVREDEVLNAAVGRYRGGSLTPESAMSVICEIAGLRFLLDGLDTDVKRGMATAQKELTND
tara:strand:+ start:368 stop:631 length:264 start_codon:yes stop_codon:yes gene_type:complete